MFFTKLNICDNGFDLEEIKYLSKVLKSNSSLTSLNINSNKIESDGVIYLCEVLKINTSLI